jgi:hypothetical protein
MTLEHGARLNWPDHAAAIQKLVENTTILDELGIDAESYADAPDKFHAEIIDHICEVIDDRAGWGESYTAWDGAADDEFSISVRSWGGIWFVEGGEQFEGYFQSEAEANDAAALLASCFPPPEE